MPTILRADADHDYPEGWMHDEDGPADPWADDDFGPLDLPELASVSELCDEFRHEAAARFEAILSGVEN